MFFKILAVAFALIPAALATITIVGPTENSYWVQFTTNVITWTAAAGDPNPVDIIVTNANNTFLNGNFSIAQFVDISQKSFTVTNVTLLVDDGYTVSFVSATNNSDILATGQTFSVKPAGTPAAPNATASGSPTSTSSGSSSTGSSAASGSSSGSSGAPSPTGGSSSSAGYRPSVGIFGAIAACAVASLAAVLL